MARQSLGGSGKKAKSKGFDSPGAPERSKEEDTRPRCTLPVAFQTSSSSSDNCALSDVLLPATFLSTLLVRPAWVNRRATTDCVVMHKAWQASVDDKKTVVLDGEGACKTRLVPCFQISLLIAPEHQEVTSRGIFRQYVQEQLQGCCLQVGVALVVTMLGQKVVFQVAQLSSDSGDVPEETAIFHQLCAATKFIFCYGSAPSSLQTPATPSATRPSFLVEETKALPDYIRAVEERFGGYPDAITLTAKTMYAGLYGSAAGDRGAVVFKPPKGLCVFGPPGVGKTALCLALMDAFRCARVAVDAVSLLAEGEAEEGLRRAYMQAQQRAPCCLFVDNADHFLPSRAATTTTDAQKRVVSCFLALLDGLQADRGVFVLAATAFVHRLDSAVRRPGRIDVEVEMAVPAYQDRICIIQRLSEALGVQLVEDSRRLVCAQSQGMVAADLALVFKEAAYALTKRCAQAATGEGDDLGALSRSVAAIALSPAPKQTSASPFRHAQSPLSPERPDTTRAASVAPSLDDWRQALQRVTPSALREVSVEVPTVRWTDIGGMDGVKRALRQVLDSGLYADEHADAAADLVRGVLLFGPPGCSKTLLAKAIATETQMNFLAVRGPELLSKWVGESEKAVQALFKRARAAAPAVVFFDEIDALAGTRGESSSGVGDRVLAQLLTELDGVAARQRVVVVAATNRPDMLDPALIRPGRIDRKIYVPPPDDASRAQILQIELAKLPVRLPVDLEELVRRSAGFSGAEVVALCNEAALFALEEDTDYVDMGMLERAAAGVTPQIDEAMLAFYQAYRQKHRTF